MPKRLLKKHEEKTGKGGKGECKVANCKGPLRTFYLISRTEIVFHIIKLISFQLLRQPATKRVTFSTPSPSSSLPLGFVPEQQPPLEAARPSNTMLCAPARVWANVMTM